MVKTDTFLFFGEALRCNYMCIFHSPSSLYENGSNLDLGLQGYELRGQMKGRGMQKKKKKVRGEKSQQQNSIHLTLFSILNNNEKKHL